jgi:hypothetical protein
MEIFVRLLCENIGETYRRKFGENSLSSRHEFALFSIIIIGNVFAIDGRQRMELISINL